MLLYSDVPSKFSLSTQLKRGVKELIGGEFNMEGILQVLKPFYFWPKCM